MEDFFRKYTMRSIFISICLIALAIILICNPIQLLNTIMIVLGVIVIVDGIWHVVSYFNEPAEFKAFSFELLEGIAEIVLGFIFVMNPEWVISIIYLIIGIWIIFSNIIKLQMSFNLKDMIANWKVMLLISVIGMLFGIFIIAHPFVTTEILSIICGVILLITETLNLFESIYLLIKMKKVD